MRRSSRPGSGGSAVLAAALALGLGSGPAFGQSLEQLEAQYAQTCAGATGPTLTACAGVRARLDQMWAAEGRAAPVRPSGGILGSAAAQLLAPSTANASVIGSRRTSDEAAAAMGRTRVPDGMARAPQPCNVDPTNAAQVRALAQQMADRSAMDTMFRPDACGQGGSNGQRPPSTPAWMALAAPSVAGDGPKPAATPRPGSAPFSDAGRAERPWQPPKWGCITAEVNPQGQPGLRNSCMEPIWTSWCVAGEACAGVGKSSWVIGARAWFPTSGRATPMAMCPQDYGRYNPANGRCEK